MRASNGDGVSVDGVPKQYAAIHERPVLQWTLERLLAHPSIHGAVVAVSANDPYWPELAARLEASAALEGKPITRVRGGVERQDSVLAALEFLQRRAEVPEHVLVHDAVRPCLGASELDAVVRAGLAFRDGALLATPVRDTLKRGAPGDAHDGRGPPAAVDETVSRERLWQAQTPQMFRLNRLHEALCRADREGARVTDEAQAVEALGDRPTLVPGCLTNLKITHLTDLEVVEAFLASRAEYG